MNKKAKPGICARILRRLSMPFAFITSLLNQATAQGSRSTVLRPLGWLIGMCLLGLLTCIEMKAPFWADMFFAILTALPVALYLVAYVYCLIKDRDALRSETYSIQRLAIERGYLGDSTAGLFETKTGENIVRVPVDSGDSQ